MSTFQASSIFVDGDLTVLSENIVPPTTMSGLADPLSRFIRIKREPVEQELLIELPTKMTSRHEPAVVGQPRNVDPMCPVPTRTDMKRPLSSVSYIILRSL